ncbi:MAG: REDY-like protein HapK [Gammaproteobacteria bacterium]
MQKILVLFNLKDGVDIAEYETWAREKDLPTARGLNAVSRFDVYRADGLMGSEDAPPYQYAEWLEVSSVPELGADAQTDEMQAVVKAFQGYADQPQFILISDIE